MKLHLSVTLLTFWVIACTNAKRTVQVQYRDYELRASYRTDSVMQQFLQPYTDSLYRYMHTIIGFATFTMYKKQPESALGNFLADGMRAMAEKKAGVHISAAFINYGGIRSAIQKGEVSVEDIYALMPYNNVIVVQKCKGSIVRSLLDHVAGRSGWPCSGISMKIRSRQAQDIVIDGAPLNENAWYYIANTDYIAGGGDNCLMLRGQEQVSSNYLFSDAMVGYVQSLTQNGKAIGAAVENRITYAP
ncbi:5'-nucleotidase C-terminal domain-containing protein [Deminuibacter soli]|uniref:5'-Nucleotidase C-terminal domain-containing protein n=1 Tax=Deminuibacter soli TaxID=2291815 RepID=A0A3E1NE02_9BACT|nr:5'-nucleotidase [Deminuibacter soli]RFM26186.1 hypothetical protein DXN05_21555 [Deminuibacter soli]